jgi:hypothetical protein
MGAISDIQSAGIGYTPPVLEMGGGTNHSINVNKVQVANNEFLTN